MAVLAGIAEKGKLASKNAWKSYIKRLRLKTSVSSRSKSEIKKRLEQKLTKAVAKRIPKGRFGILFSGGVDSSLIALICKKLKADFICYTVGVEKSRDAAEAKKAAAKMKLKLRCKLFTLKGAEAVIRKAAAVIGKPDAVNIGIACVSIAAAQLAKKDGIRALFTGLGSEEIFAGYRRHELAKDANKECWKGLENMLERDFVRDSKVATAMSVSFLTPFLDERLIIEAMGIPQEYKISGSEKKIILRETAAGMGLPIETAFRKKLAAQYGSGFDKALELLAKKNHLKYKRDYTASITSRIHYSNRQFSRR